MMNAASFNGMMTTIICRLMVCSVATTLGDSHTVPDVCLQAASIHLLLNKNLIRFQRRRSWENLQSVFM
ncbi:hypothetical protein ACA910_000138 [Epithemia clementina (nom. ined.)]